MKAPPDGLGAGPARLKRSAASLVGGVACGVCGFALYLLLAGEASPANIAVGLAIGAALGAWVRLADL
jgi:hypothetical protein